MQRSLIFAMLFVLAASAAAAQQGPKPAPRIDARREQINENAQAALDKLFAQQPSARRLFDQAAGYAVFGATKAAFLFVSGGAGSGVAVDKHSGKRTYMRMATGGVGLGVGAQTFDLVILFQGEGQIERFVRGGWNATTGAAAAAGQSGVAAASSVVNGIAVFQLTDKGLLAQADVSGARFWRFDQLN
jgi:lipid-binding SYLF domain-containing protein